MRRTGHLSNTRRENGAGYIDERTGYIYLKEKGIKKCLHVFIAEKALGKPLPKGAVVHHADGDRSNNKPENLVVCPDQAYHMLIHRRQKAFEECGNPDYYKCWYCKEYDAEENLRFSRWPQGYHDACASIYNKNNREDKTTRNARLKKQRDEKKKKDGTFGIPFQHSEESKQKMRQKRLDYYANKE